MWKTETRKQRNELERVAFYHCDQVGTPQSLSNELGECVWSIRQSTWGRAEKISQPNPDNPFEQTEIRFQGQYTMRKHDYTITVTDIMNRVVHGISARIRLGSKVD